jgi:hypothetical protein
VHRCAHGYGSLDDCPRCRPRDVLVKDPARASVTHSRWHGTTTTMPPAAKLACTAALVLPVLVCLLGLTQAQSHLANAFLVVPLAGLIILNVRLLPEIWEKARQM